MKKKKKSSLQQLQKKKIQSSPIATGTKQFKTDFTLSFLILYFPQKQTNKAATGHLAQPCSTFPLFMPFLCDIQNFYLNTKCALEEAVLHRANKANGL